MKLSHFFAGAVILSTAACGQFSEVTLNIQSLDADKQVLLLRNTDNFAAVVDNVVFEFENGVLLGDKFDAEIFDNITAEFDLGDEVIEEIEAGDLIIDADKLYDDFEYTLQNVTVTLLADLNDDTIQETEITVELTDLNLTFEFNDLGVNSVKQNIAMVLELSPRLILDQIDIQQAVIDQVVNVNSVVLDQVLLINENDTPNEFDDAVANIEDPAKAFTAFVYNVQGQQEKVKP